MKKIISIMLLAILTISILTGISYAADLDTIDIKVDKTTVRPGEEVKLTVEFGQDLGAYTFDVSYDNNIFDYVSVNGGTPNDTGDKVKVTFHDTTGGTNPRANMEVVFRAKADITTSNPTEFTFTAEGLANQDASVTFDDITTPIVKNVTVEPEYVDYTLKLENAGELVKAVDNDMLLSYSSPMGRYYEHVRLVAEVTKPAGANVQLIGVDQAGLEHDILESGWGDAQGFKIGGKNYAQNLQTKAIFSVVGDYTITLKLIDRDDSDKAIAEETFSFKVAESGSTTGNPDNGETVTPETPPKNPGETPSSTPEAPSTTPTTPEETTKTEMPTRLPKTGNNIFIPVVVILIALSGIYVFYNKEN